MPRGKKNRQGREKALTVKEIRREAGEKNLTPFLMQTSIKTGV